MIRATFGSTGRERSEVFTASDKHALHKIIDESTELNTWEKDVLKYGYFKEFKTNPYNNTSYVIDNCMHFIWEVNYEDDYGYVR